MSVPPDEPSTDGEGGTFQTGTGVSLPVGTPITPPGSFHPAGGTPPRSGTPVPGGTLEALKAAHAPLTPGQPFGHRYHLIRLLGAGGMGAVYQAWDQELDVIVAIKVIRPEAMADPSVARDLERRFKRELLLARNVTHRNVVRIHDLGEIDGIKYITMPYVHGTDLASLLKREGKLPVSRALNIAKQVASGLVSAHEAGVVHRDLKPANIMLDEEEKPLITDFGIARSTSGAGGGTIAGAVVGTLEYMAPEQARGELVDHRADIYAFGLILHDMLVGKRHTGAGAESAVAALMARMTKPLPSLRSIDAQIPQTISDIVARCTAIDPAVRYQRTQDLAAHLESLDANGHPVSATAHPIIALPATTARSRPKLPAAPLPWLIGALAALVLVAGTVMFRDRIVSPSPAQAVPETTESVSLAILPFRNASGDGSLDWLASSIPETLRTEIGHSSSLRTIAPDRLYQILRDLRISPDSTLDPPTLSRLADLSSADVVVWGQYVKFGNEIRIDATLQDVKLQRAIPLKAQAPSEAGLLPAIGDLARGVRENLSLSAAAVGELAAKAFRPSTSSVDALKYYNEGLTAIRDGKVVDARKHFEAAVQEDPGFALGYAYLAETYAASGQAARAEQFSRQALGLTSGLSQQERYLIEAKHAQIVTDFPKAIDAYENLAKILDDDEVLFRLGTLYAQTGAYEQARDAYGKLLTRDPKHVAALIGAADAEAQLGKAQQSLEHLNRALTLAVQSENPEQQATIRRALGDAYEVLNKPDESLLQYQQSLAIEQRLNRKAGIADVLFGMGTAYKKVGKYDAALKAYEESLSLRRAVADRRGIADVLVGLGSLHGTRGDYNKELTFYKQSLPIYREIGSKSREAVVLNNIGTALLDQGNFEEARTYFERALTLHEHLKVPGAVADTLHNLGGTSFYAGDFDGAVRHYLGALEHRRQAGDVRGEAVELYSIGEQYEYQGQFRKAIESHELALQKLRDLGEGGFWLPAIQAQYASALSRAGRTGEAQPLLAEALALSERLAHQPLVSQILTFLGDNSYYQGDLKQARMHYDRALQVATAGAVTRFPLISRAGLARIAIAEGNPRNAIQPLRQLRAELDANGLKYVAVECSVYLAEALLNTGDPTEARDELETVLRTSERLGLRTLLVRSHYLLSLSFHATGDSAGARRHAEQARRALQAISQEQGVEQIVKRFDLAPVLQDPTR